MTIDRRGLLAGSIALAGVGLSVREALAAVTTASPESVGFSAAGLAELDKAMHGLVDEQKLAGVTTLVARHGKVVHFDAYGKRDLTAGAPMEKDTIFRIASMTKPITGVAMMMLWEQGEWKLTDPVDQHIPQFRGLKVQAKDGSLVNQTKPMTMAQLMSHTAGFGVNADYEGQKFSEGDLQGMIDKLAKLPLKAQPGTDFLYGPSVNIQGYLVEKFSGKTLDRFFADRIFKPLGMVDTGFWVPPEKASRVAKVNTYKDGKIVELATQNDPTRKPTFLAGSGGLLSTTEDYWRFAQMVANGGEAGGKRFIKASTVKLMRTNVLEPGVFVDVYGPNQPGLGFGLDFAVLMSPAAARSPQGFNTFYWGGAFGTWFWIDPENDVVYVGMIQNLNGSVPGGGTPAVREISPRLTYAALTNRKT
ncbi:MAG: serine hydrolase domain-containing protein [Phenylobacterium sp.]